MQIVQPDDDWLINNIKVGYAKQDYNYPLGRQEFAVTLEFDNQLNVDSKTLDLVSKYRADYTGVHLLHYAYVNSDKKDSKSDNDVFFILAYGTSTKSITAPFDNITIEDILVSVGQNVSKGQPLFVFEVQKLYNTVTADDDCKILSINVNVGDVLSAGSIILTVSYNDWTATQGDRVTHIDGLDGGGYFNILLSPKTMLISHARFFASLLDKHAKILRYTSSTETMSALEYTDTELGHVVEKADLSVANAEPFFKPFIFMFNCVVPVSLSEIMGETPCGYFTFEYNNLILKGFPVDIQGSYTNSEQIVKCIAHPATPDNIQEILHKRLPNKLYK
jgi:biotin carboxyl carrier protein